MCEPVGTGLWPSHFIPFPPHVHSFHSFREVNVVNASGTGATRSIILSLYFTILDRVDPVPQRFAFNLGPYGPFGHDDYTGETVKQMM